MFEEIDPINVSHVDIGCKRDAQANGVVAQLFWSCRAEENGGKFHSLCKAELLPQERSKNRQKYHVTDGNCYMKIICQK